MNDTTTCPKRLEVWKEGATSVDVDRHDLCASKKCDNDVETYRCACVECMMYLYFSTS